MFGLEHGGDMRCFVIDNHRPIHLSNVYSRYNVVVFDEYDTRGLDPADGPELGHYDMSSISRDEDDDSSDEGRDDDDDDDDEKDSVDDDEEGADMDGAMNAVWFLLALQCLLQC
jgi:hypothetical protein